MRGLEVPEGLRARPFTVVEGRAAGLRAADLRSTRLHAPTRGIRAVSEPSGVEERARAFARAMPPDAAFSHVTAAQLLRLPLPAGPEGQKELDVIRSGSVAQVRRRGCHGHRGLERRQVVEVDGMRIVGPADTWVDLAEVAGRGIGVDDLVVVGDVVANRTPAGTDALVAALRGRVRPRGKALLVESLPLVRVGSRSPMETRSRLMFHRAGFPEPELNAVVRDSHGGWLLEGDLVWRKQRVVGEYQGSDHASIRRRSADSSRSTGAEAAGYRVLEIYAEDVYRGARRRACLTRFATAMHLDPASFSIE